MAWTPKDSNLYQNDGFMFQNPANTGIGNWFANMDKWKAMNGEGEGRHIGQDAASSIADLNKNGVGQALGNAWMDGGNPHGQYNQQLYDAMKSYTYKGDDGKQYMINGNYYHGGAVDQEGQHTNGDLMFGGVGALGHADQGRQAGEMAYSVTGFKPDWGGDTGAFNGQMFDMYDRNGKYVGGNLPMSMGDDQMGKTGALIAAMVASAGMAGMALAPAAGAGMGAGAGAGGAGAMGVEGIGGMGGMMGVEGAGAVGGGGAILSGGAPAGFVGAGEVAAGLGGAAGAGGAGGGSSFLSGLGSIGGSDLLKYGSMLAGAVSGGQGQEQSMTSTKELPDWLQGPVAGGLIPQANWLMNDQMNTPSTGLLSSSKNKKKKARKGLL